MKILLENAFINNQKQNLLIENRLIKYIGNETPDFDKKIDLEGKTIIPGLIDGHVHVRDLGHSDKEDWLSASRAAIAGGITTIFDMPNNKPPTINLKNLNMKREVARKALVNYKFNLGVTGHNLPDVTEILKSQPGDIAALKLFLAGSSANEFVEDIDQIKRIFDLSLQFDLPVIIHTELQKCIEKHQKLYPQPDIFYHNAIRHRDCANAGTELVIQLAKAIGNKIYIAHTSTAEEIEIIRQNKSKASIFCEVTPHHLLLNQTVLATAGNYAKVNPPIRTLEDNKALWQGIADGTVDTIGTDHAPHLLAEKLKAYKLAPSGFPGLETALPLLLNEVNNGRLTLKKLIELTAHNPAKIFNLSHTGQIKTGFAADLCVVDMDKKCLINPDKFYTKAKYSPYAGITVKGLPVMTIINGKIYNLN